MAKYYKLSEKSSLYVDPSNPTFVIRNNEVVKVNKLSREAELALTQGHIREASEKDYKKYQDSLTKEEKAMQRAAATTAGPKGDEDDEDEDENQDEEEEDEEEDEDDPADWSKTRLIDSIRDSGEIPEEEKKGLTNKSKEDLVTLYTKYVK